MISLIIGTLIATVLSAFCYRVGGMSKESAKSVLPLFPQVLVASWFRDANCTLITLIWSLLYLPHVAWYWYIPACGFMYAAMTTYWDDKLPPKGIDKFWAHGLMIRIAWLFIAIPAGRWWQCLVSSIVLSIFMGVWCKIFSNDFVEEYGRGGAIQATLPLINIGG